MSRGVINPAASGSELFEPLRSISGATVTFWISSSSASSMGPSTTAWSSSSSLNFSSTGSKLSELGLSALGVASSLQPVYKYWLRILDREHVVVVTGRRFGACEIITKKTDMPSTNTKITCTLNLAREFEVLHSGTSCGLWWAVGIA